MIQYMYEIIIKNKYKSEKVKNKRHCSKPKHHTYNKESIH